MSDATDIIQFNYGELCLPVEALKDCNHQGQCDDDVEYWEKEIDWKAQSMDAEAIRKQVSEYCDWDVSDELQNRRRLLWIAAGNWQDERLEKDED